MHEGIERMRILQSLLLFCIVLPAWAGNAAWYRWESRVDGSFVCAQTPPGDGWTRIAGPFRDATCSKPR
jgi:hypothetical protein